MKSTRFRGFKLFYQHADSMESMCREADHFPSFFTPRNDEALIVDCGANIGVSVLEWKYRWPQAKILCFEPDPFAFAVLERNIRVNDIPQVRCINAAVSDHNGDAILYGNIAAGSDARGNSLDANWGERPGTSTHRVGCKRLSQIISDLKIDFLKLDVEGHEEHVLADIHHCLPQIDAIYVEVHQTEASMASNSPENIKTRLVKAGFRVESESRYDEFSLPPSLASWQARVNARQTQLLCWR